MHVLHLAKYYPPAVGGMEYFLRDLARHQAASGMQCSILAHNHNPFTASVRERVDGCRLTRSATLGTLVYAPVAPLYGPQLMHAALRTKPDIIHAHLPNTSAFWLLAVPTGRASLILHWHSDVVASNIDKRIAMLYRPYRVLEQALLRKAKAVITTSQRYQDASQALAPHAHKCRCVPLGLSPARLPEPDERAVSSLKERYGNRRIILSLGRFAYYKGFNTLVDAAAHLHDAAIVIIGDGPEKPRLRRQVEQAGLTDRVFFPGRLSEEEVCAHMASCDVFCLPSIERTEAFGLVLLEAMRYGKPLVTSDLAGSGMSFVNEDGATGLHAAMGDAHALSSAIRTILDDPHLAETMGKASRRRFEEHFHISKVHQDVAAVYEEALA